MMTMCWKFCDIPACFGGS